MENESDGYVIGADKTVWTIHCSGNIDVKMQLLHQNIDDNSYIITNETFTYNNITFSVVEYDPI